MLGTLKIIEHPEVVGEPKHSHAYQGELPETYELKLREFCSTLRGAIPNEPNMRDDWIVSVSLGETIQFQYGATKTTMVSTELKSLSVLGMSRYLWHAVPKVSGERWNITFRCWKSNPDFRRLSHTFAPAEARAASSSVSSRHRQCTLC